MANRAARPSTGTSMARHGMARHGTMRHNRLAALCLIVPSCPTFGPGTALQGLSCVVSCRPEVAAGPPPSWISPSREPPPPERAPGRCHKHALAVRCSRCVSRCHRCRNASPRVVPPPRGCAPNHVDAPRRHQQYACAEERRGNRVGS
jgi:hypothetical protein